MLFRSALFYAADSCEEAITACNELSDRLAVVQSDISPCMGGPDAKIAAAKVLVLQFEKWLRLIQTDARQLARRAES